MRTFSLTILFLLSGSITVSHCRADSPESVAAQVDRLFRQSWQQEEITPAATTNDAEYLRRLYLDLAGRIPAVSEARDFFDSNDANKRRQIVEQLLDSPASVRHFTTVWRNALIPQASSQPEFRGLIPGFEAWLWEHFSERRSYDQIARSIITSELNSNNGPALTSTTSPDAFFLVRELKPENLATGTARAFLGVRLDCAQCHDHPFDKWKQTQFWNMAAFYAGFGRPDDEDNDTPLALMNRVEQTDLRSIRIPGTEETVPAVFLNGNAPDWSRLQDVSPRQQLADWIVDKSNPYFSRMAVNRLWAQFFGRGFVDPVDDFSDNNPPSHPEILDLLASDFVASGYDLQRLVKVITATEVYQLSSVQSHESQQSPANFARAPLRGLSPEQLFDSLAEAVGYYQPFRSDNPFVVETESSRAEFLDMFRDNAESPLDRETTVLQALAMMNGDFIANATSLENSQTLKAIAEFPAINDKQKLEALFLAALGRFPTTAEQDRFGEYLESGGPTEDPQTALADIFWALLNSSEFLLNH